jgi:hypothetical protein
MGPLANAFTDARATTANTTTKRDFDTIEIIEKNSFQSGTCTQRVLQAEIQFHYKSNKSETL